MNWMRRVFARRSTADSLTDEMRAHVAERVDDLVERGVPLAEATRQAHREFGNVAVHAENSRDVWTTRPARVVVSIVEESRLALRRLRARPVASFGSIVTLATSIGAAAATWSLFSAVLLHPLPVRDPDRLFVLAARDASSPRLTTAHLYPLYAAVRSTDVFTGLAAGGSITETVEAAGVSSSRTIFFSSYDYFDTLGVPLAMGRAFSAQDDQVGAPLTAVLSDRLWRSAFGAASDVLGQDVSVNGKHARIVGVAPHSFRGLSLSEAPDLYMPLHVIRDVSSSPINNFFAQPDRNMSPSAWVGIVGRLRPGVSASDAAARLTGLGLASARGSTFVLTDVVTAALPAASRADIAHFTRLLGGAVGLLLLIGCLSVGMLLLVRTEARRGEFAMCLALGATRSRLARGIVLEGALLSLAGALLALPASQWLFAGLRTFQLPGSVNVDMLGLEIDGRVFAGVTTAALVATIVIALLAGSLGFSANVGDALRSRSGVTPRVGRRRARATLVVAEVAVAMVLVTGAGLFARSLSRALNLNSGVDTNKLVTLSVNGYRLGYDATRTTSLLHDLRDRLSASPAFVSVGLTKGEGGMSGGGRLTIDGESQSMPSFTEFIGVDEHYFRTIGLPITQGRDFDAGDVAGAPLVAIVSASVARFVANGGDPLGHHIAEFFNFAGQPPRTIDVVGVVPDVITQVTRLQPLVLYMPLAQRPPSPTGQLVFRAAGSASAAMREATGIVRQVDPKIDTSFMRSIDDGLLQGMAPQRFGVFVLTALGAIALILTLLGTAVLAETTAVMRQREMGIRAALGASRLQLAGLMLTDTLRLIAVGLVAGLGLSWLAAGTIRSFLFQVQPLDEWTMATVAAGILFLALAASLKPIRRIATLQLTDVLREQ